MTRKEQVAALAGQVADAIRANGHMQDPYYAPPGQRFKSSLVHNSGYADAPQEVREEFLQALNRKTRVEKRPQLKRNFGPLARLLEWEARVPTDEVLSVLDAVAGR